MIGIDSSAIDLLNPDRALRRIRADLQTDFIYAPHLSAIYSEAADALTEQTLQNLRSGKLRVQLPITLAVPKASGFGRTGAILWPRERLAYQLLVDAVAPMAEAALDRSTVFSYRLLKLDPSGAMFEPAGQSYANFTHRLYQLHFAKTHRYVLKADVASFFDRLNLHRLQNALESSGCDAHVVSALNKLLLQLSSMNSYGILQGLFPSDFLGNFYLGAVDAKHALAEMPSARYVDDMYIFFKTRAAAEMHKITLGSWLHADGLCLNEAKTSVISSSKVLFEESSDTQLLADAEEEVRERLQSEDFYGTIMYWDEEADAEIEEDKVEETIKLKATRLLFDQMVTGVEVRRHVDRFCITAFTATKDDYAIDYVLEKYGLRPDMAQLFARYLREFISHDVTLRKRVQKMLLEAKHPHAYQRMWLYALLMSAQKTEKAVLDGAARELRRAGVAEPVKAACAVLLGRYGTGAQRLIVREHYSDEPSEFVRAAVLYATRHFPKSERDACFKAWGGQSDNNALLVKACRSLAD